jgi:DHA1 family multidrug resistance protein-like MFS transporter
VSASSAWRRNLFAVTAASFIGFTGFTLVMPFLPLFIRQLGVTDVGEIALWTGAILGVTPALTALLSPFWGRLADRFGRKLMVMRSLVSCAVVMAAMAFVTHPWHVFALRALLGLFTGYGGLTLSMAAESAPRGQMAAAIGLVQTAQRLGPAIGPVIGGVLAGALGLRGAFIVTAALYTIALALIVFGYHEGSRSVPARAGGAAANGGVGFRSVLAFENFMLLMAVVFGIQFVDRSVGPILPLYIEQMGVPRERVAVIAGLLFSAVALSGAGGHHFCGRLLKRFSSRVVISSAVSAAAVAAAVMGSGVGVWALAGAMMVFGVGIGVASTAAYTAAGSVIPAGAHATGFGFLSSAALTGLAVSPVVSGFLAATSLRGVFWLDVIVLGLLAVVVRRLMAEAGPITSPAVEDA